jgi:hypothetical protein
MSVTRFGVRFGADGASGALRTVARMLVATNGRIGIRIGI